MSPSAPCLSQHLTPRYDRGDQGLCPIEGLSRLLCRYSCPGEAALIRIRFCPGQSRDLGDGPKSGLPLSGWLQRGRRPHHTGSAPAAAALAAAGASLDLHDLFYPKSIAVIGASGTPGKLGWNVFTNLVSHKFGGKLYPINPRADEICGHKTYPRISAVPEPVDVASCWSRRE